MKVRIGIFPEASRIKIAMIVEFFLTGSIMFDLVLIAVFVSHGTSIIRTLIVVKINEVNGIIWGILLSPLLRPTSR